MTTMPFTEIRDFTQSPKPSDEDLPQIPEMKTFFVRDHRGNQDIYTGHIARIEGSWIRIGRITGYAWEYTAHLNQWDVQPTIETVSRTSSGGVYAWGLAE